MSLQIQEVESPLYSKLINNSVKAGNDFYFAVTGHTIDMMGKAEKQDLSSALVIDVPRGGIPTGEGVYQTLLGDEVKLVKRTHSNIKSPEKELLDPEVSSVNFQDAIICDGVIATGTSIMTHLDFIIENNVAQNIAVVANAVAQKGCDALASYAEEKEVEIKLVTGRVYKDEECQWMDFDGKKVYMVGFNQENNFDDELPDFGDQLPDFGESIQLIPRKP